MLRILRSSSSADNKFPLIQRNFCSLSTNTQHLSNCFVSCFSSVVSMLVDILWHNGSSFVQSWWYIFDAFIAMVICQDAFLAILMYWKRPVSTASSGCITTDFSTETNLASNHDPWSVVGVWQVVE